MPSYRVDRVAMCQAALRRGIRPTGRAIALAAGIPAQTVNALWTDSRREPSLKVMAAIVGALGGTLTDYLILVETKTPEPVH